MSTIPYTLKFNCMGEWARQQSLFKLRDTYVAYGVRGLKTLIFYEDLNKNCDMMSLFSVKRLKTDKYNDDGIIMSNNFQHGTSLLFTRIAQLFSAMLYYGYAPQLFLRSTMIPIPKGGKVCSTNADLYRSIAISSILSKILDYVIIDQQSDSLCTSDYQFGFKSHSSTMLCSPMLIETIQYYDENGRQPLYVLFLDARKAFDPVCYSELFIYC